MNSTPDIWRRLFWKEYRLQRVYWLVLAGAGGLTLAGAVFLEEQSPGNRLTLWLIALVFTGLYAVGSAATLFAGERENQTLPLQQMLPVSGRTLFAAKFTFAALTALLMLALLVLAPLVFAATHPALAAWESQVVVVGLVTIAELLVWSSIASLQLRHALSAALAGAGAAVLMNSIHLPQGNQGAITAGRLLATCGALALAALVGARRLVPGHARRFGHAGETPAIPPTSITGALAWPHAARVMARLLWQEHRQGWKMRLALAALVLATLLTQMPGDQWGLSGLLAAIVVPLIAGVCCFAADKRDHGIRRLAWMGVSPALTWWSRQLHWGGLALLSSASVAMLGPRQSALFALSIGGICYAGGQFCSQLIRRSLTALVTAVLVGCLLGAWTSVMAAARVPAWSVVPIPLLLLAITLWRMPRWMDDRGRPLAMSLALALPLIGLASAVAVYRATEIPPAPPLETGGTFQHVRSSAAQSLLDYAAQLRMEDAQLEEFLPDIIEAAETPGLYFVDGVEALQPIQLDNVRSLGRELQRAASQHQAAGELTAAWNCLRTACLLAAALRQHAPETQHDLADEVETEALTAVQLWAAAGGQTTQRIQLARRWLVEHHEGQPGRETAAGWRLLDARRYVDRVRQGDWVAQRDWQPYASSLRRAAVRLMPWETRRLERVLQHLVAAEHQCWRQLSLKLSSPSATLDSRPGQSTMSSIALNYEWVLSTIGACYCQQVLQELHQAEQATIGLERLRRATRMTLALRAAGQAGQHEAAALSEAVDDALGGEDLWCRFDPLTGKRSAMAQPADGQPPIPLPLYPPLQKPE